MKVPIYKFDESDQGQRTLENLGLGVRWAIGDGKRLFAWVELKPESIERPDIEYFLRKGSRVIANLEASGELHEIRSHPVEQKYLQRYAKSLPSQN